MNYEPSDAVCSTSDPEAWFPEISGPYDRAFRICCSCPIQRECLKFSFDNREEYGIWGGIGETQRVGLFTTYFRRTFADRERMIDNLMDARNEEIAGLWDKVHENAERRRAKKRKQNRERRGRRKLEIEGQDAA